MALPRAESVAKFPSWTPHPMASGGFGGFSGPPPSGTPPPLPATTSGAA